MDRNEYQNNNCAFAVLGSVAIAIGLASAAYGIPTAVAQGGMNIGWGRHAFANSWVPMWPALILILAAAIAFAGAGLNLILTVFNSRIVTDDEGIVQVNCLRKETFRARWEEIRSITLETGGKFTEVNVATADKNFALLSSNLHRKEIVRDIERHTGLKLGESRDSTNEPTY